MTERMAWRRAVRRSRLPSGVKLTLLTHSERGAGYFHDEATNRHGHPQRLIADSTNRDEATVKRNLRRAKEDGFLVEHERGDRGQPQGRGHQTVFHYVTPNDPWACESCGKGDTPPDQKGGLPPTPSVPLREVQNVPPSSTSHATSPEETDERRHLSLVPDEQPQPGAHTGPAPSSPLQRSSPSHEPLPQPHDGPPVTGSVSETTTGRARDPEPTEPPACTACGLPLHPALAAAEPWHTTHPACDEPGDQTHDPAHVLASITADRGDR